MLCINTRVAVNTVRLEVKKDAANQFIHHQMGSSRTLIATWTLLKLPYRSLVYRVELWGMKRSILRAPCIPSDSDAGSQVTQKSKMKSLMC